MENKITVAKFGGTSVANVDSISRCINIVSKSNQIKVVVVSAQSGVTNLLVKLVTECDTKEFINDTLDKIRDIISPIVDSVSNNKTSLRIAEILKDLEQLANMLLRLKTPQLSDEILSFGELISATIVTELLVESGIAAKHISAKKFIKTDSNHGHAKPLIDDIKSNAQKELMPYIKGNLIVTEGFIGTDHNNLTTTLGRGGSDYSAALIAEAIQAQALQIWTDVAGVYQADPRAIPQATAIGKMSFNEASELATFGAKVLHPSTLWPAVRSDIDVFIGSTFDSENSGTWITKDVEQDYPTIRAVAERKNQVLLTIKSFDMVHAQGFLANVFQILAKHKVSVDLVTTSEVNIAITLDHIGSQSIGNTILTSQLLDELKQIGNVEVNIDENLSLIAIVGNNIHQTKSVSSRLFSALSGHNIRLFSHGASGHNMCLLVDQKDSSEVTKKIYNQFF